MITPSYQELEERVKNLENQLEAAYNVIRIQDDKIERQRRALDETWALTDLKIDHAKSFR